MQNTNATAGMQYLFANYHITMSCRDLNHQRKSENCSATCTLCRMASLSLRWSHLGPIFLTPCASKGVHWFFRHAIRLAKEFQMVDIGPTTKVKTNNKNQSQLRSGNGNGQSDFTTNKDPKDKEDPLYLWERHQEKSLDYLLRDCFDCPDDEKAPVRKAGRWKG